MHDRAMMFKWPIKVGVDKHGSMWGISYEKGRNKMPTIQTTLRVPSITSNI